MSRVLPILFNIEMVRAILDDRKRVTRRVVKQSVWENFVCEGGKVINYLNKKTDTLESPVYKAPYHLGDILYVRETWSWEPCWDCGMDTEEHNCCDETAHKVFNHDKGEAGCYLYKASVEDNVYPSVDVWHPSIHMPKEAARIWLKVTDVRVERLQEITKEKIKGEGIYDDGTHPTDKKIKIRPEIAHLCGEWTDESYKERFAMIWDSTIKKSDLARYGWEANPWVWVIEFERCEKLEGEMGSKG